jgi:hypothetical protein
VILNYPMPKRNYKCTISITYWSGRLAIG